MTRMKVIKELLENSQQRTSITPKKKRGRDREREKTIYGTLFNCYKHMVVYHSAIFINLSHMHG